MTFSYRWCGVSGPSLFRLVGDARVELDPEGVREAFGEIPATGASCIQGARRLSSRPPERDAPPRPLRALLEEALGALPRRRIALALSGGVDSAVLAGILGDGAVAYTLAPEFPDYGEETVALEVARTFGIEVRRVEVRERDYVRALPEAIRACETPLYNLHPVSRHLLAQAARADGFDVLVTGDGADELFGGSSGADYLPIVDALVRATGLLPYSPFLDPEVRGAVRVDPTKRTLRDVAVELGVPRDVALAPKRPRMTPPMDVSAHWDAPSVTTLARTLHRAPSRATDRERVAWTTLALFARHLPGLLSSCAA